MVWIMLLSYPLMSAIQLVSARIGRVTGSGLAVNMGAIWPKWLVTGLVCLLFVANCINIGANLAAMGASVELATGMPSLPITIFFALLSLGLQMFIPNERYANILKWLTLVLFAYIAVLFVVKIDWMATLKGFVWPTFPLNTDSFTVVVAILGTTISPYLFFWQSSQEVEEIDRRTKPSRLRRRRVKLPKS
ncbi:MULTISPECIES: NRAMP family divalent metal transporter [Brucella]|uniref:NRAMP family divalent metal transporter n=1 Tax=Brucella TaxID=234 RepID=UPI0004BC3A71|nr:MULTISPECIES: divalent metal cation transporter [Brucella]